MTPEPIPIKVSRAPEARDIPLPAYQSEHASGMDLRAAVVEPVTLAPGAVALIPTGLHLAVPPGFEAQVRPRSGLALKHGIFVVNTPGTIDADYRGEVGVIVGNIGPAPFRIERGDRIAQLVVAPVARAAWCECDQLDETERGHGGFGHTGH